MSINNPLLDFSGLPRYNEIKPEYITPAVDALLKQSCDVVSFVLSNDIAPTWENFVIPLDIVSEQISRAWGQVSHLNSVMNSPAIREAYNDNLPKLSKYYSELGQNLELYAKFKELSESEELKFSSIAKKKVIENELLGFKLSGAELSSDNKIRFLEINEELSKLSSQFKDNILDATNAFSLTIEDIKDLSGIPEDDIQVAAETAKEAGKIGWMFTLKTPSYMAIMEYADNRFLRETFYKAFVTRASEFDDVKLDNAPIISQIIKLKSEKAKLLGYSTAAELSLVTKMADTPDQVLSFLREIALKARPIAEKELLELRNFANKIGILELQSWDIAYVSEKLRQELYSYSNQEIKQYFQEDIVLYGLFNVVKVLYKLDIQCSTTQTWHETVKFFDVKDEVGNLIGQFYIDLYARESKRSGAWMSGAIDRKKLVDGKIQVPVAHLTCNFSAPANDKSALLTLDEVITLFHEFGHCLHHLLTLVEDIGVSGISGVEWDAVELPSQLMENFCWEWDVLSNMTSHVDTGEIMHKELFNKLLAAKNFHIGLQTLRQVEFSIFDMLLHSSTNDDVNTLELLDKVRSEIAVFIPPKYNRFPNGFSHIFGGGYAAGYYGYKWSEVLSADAYSLFEEHGVLNPEIGEKFRKEFLSVGGSRPAMQSFIAFRGREPKIDALLRHNGLTI